MPTACLTIHNFPGASVGIPLTRTRPSFGTRRPFSRRARVDFPDPLGPMTATYSPGAIFQSHPGAPSFARGRSSGR